MAEQSHKIMQSWVIFFLWKLSYPINDSCLHRILFLKNLKLKTYNISYGLILLNIFIWGEKSANTRT